MRVPTLILVVVFYDDATTPKGPGCDDGTHLRKRDFAVVPVMPTRNLQSGRNPFSIGIYYYFEFLTLLL